MVSVEEVPRFRYLGSMINNTNDPSDDVNNRIRAAHQAFGRLSSQVFHQRGLTLETKLNVYRTTVLPTILYGSEC